MPDETVRDSRALGSGEYIRPCADPLRPAEPERATAEERSWQGRDLSLSPTVFDRLSEALCRRLVYRGWWLAGAATAHYFPELAPPPTSLTPPPLPAG